MKTYLVEHRGFTVIIRQRPGLGWCASWQEEAGETRGKKFGCETSREAFRSARQAIENYYARETRELEVAKSRKK